MENEFIMHQLNLSVHNLTEAVRARPRTVQYNMSN